VLSLIEWRRGLSPLTVRDATANNLATALNFSSPSLTALPVSVPAGPFGVVCGAPPVVPSNEEWAPIAALAQTYSWPAY
jgi:phospholipase C